MKAIAIAGASRNSESGRSHDGGNPVTAIRVRLGDTEKTVTGRDGWALHALIERGPRGVTPIDNPVKAALASLKQRATLPAVTPDLPEPKTSPAPTGEDFDWLNDNSVVLREQPETAVYFNRDGALVIRQRAAWNQEGDPFVFISPANIGEFLDKLTEACGVPLAGRQ